MSAMKTGFQIAECSLSSAKRYNNHFFQKLICVTTCNIVRTLYWWFTVYEVIEFLIIDDFVNYEKIHF